MATESVARKNAIVTGGSRGIGKGISLELAKRGANILLAYQSSRDQAEEVAAAEIRRSGVDAIAVEVAVNLKLPVFLIQASMPYFGKMPRIVHLSSAYARDGQSGCLAYVACKGAMESLTRSLARDLSHNYQATINCVCPGPVNTELWAATIEDPHEKEKWDFVVQNTPAAARVAEVDDSAQIVGFLAEGRSRWTTGSLVNANGGLLFV
ncbi:short chain dehydrogenase [Aspergillus avenaceus]|uniref:Short chain dehydrogenase n=1 Tax=Aspergillus avenaceus TaxID=36643 RepID=A0A5N6U667_ASPAV|nr:short chain dehydrogenase [Aspergillus avenaceus]